MYYACLKDKNGFIEKVPFEKREDARKYISENYDVSKHTQVWTE